MSLDNIRKDIDAIDSQIRELIMKRLDCSKRVVQSKIEDGNYVIHRPDREAAILKRLGNGIPEDRKDGYLAVVRKITETSRMYQYGILYDRMNELFLPLAEGIHISSDCKKVVIALSIPDIPNGIASILSMIGDYGYNLSDLSLLNHSEDKGSAEFRLTIQCNLNEDEARKLMVQLSSEGDDFRIIEAN
ncbi:MAG: chorismate mutase [Bacillota bacterium]|nr:chorismate mutase [Bacillota bacterium]